MPTSTPILVTGGAGYIGSHTVVQLLSNGHDVIIFDNLSNSSAKVVDRIGAIAHKSPQFINGDIRDRDALRTVFKNYSIGSVIHFAGLKAVAESEEHPLKYYDNNVVGSIALCDEMLRAKIDTLVFSSSATVYGAQEASHFSEDMPLAPINVYGRTKLAVETLLKDVRKSNPHFKCAILRYFNPVGAHESGQIGEHPLGIPNNLVPFIAQVAVNRREKLMVFGKDYPTKDGTGLRDYVHVDDLAAGHLAALRFIEKEKSEITVNLGTGKPSSVLEVIHAFEDACQKKIRFEIAPRRAGDLAETCADVTRAKKLLKWEARYDLARMCRDAWRWQNANPNGYT